MYRWKPWTMLLAACLIFSTTACATKKQGSGTNGNTNRNITINEKRIDGDGTLGSKNQYSTSGIRNRGAGITPSAIHNNTRMEMNQHIADAVNSLPEVQSSRAIVTDSNAYVAVKLKDHATDAATASNKTESRTAGSLDQGNTAAGGSNVNASNTADNVSNNNNSTKTSSDGPIKKITSGITGNSFDLQSPQPNVSEEMPGQIKQKIVDKVRSISDPTLQHVYISANPDFIQRMENYAADVRQGNLLSGAVREFNVMVQRIFPTTAGTGAYGGSASSSQLSDIIGNSNGPMEGKSGGAKEK